MLENFLSLYFLNRIVTATTGSLFGPAAFGDLVAWIDPRYNITKVSGDGSAVTAWNDTSDNGYTGTVLGEPRYEVGGWNGMPAVLFDGVNDALAMNSIASHISGADKPVYVVAAIQMLQTITGRSLFSAGHSGTPPNNRYRELGTITSQRYYPASRDDSFTIDADPSNVNALTTNYITLVWAFEGTTVSLYINGTVDSFLNGTSQDVGTITLDKFTIANRIGNATGASWTHMRVGPILVYTSLTDRAGAEAWLQSEGYGSFTPRNVPGLMEFWVADPETMTLSASGKTQYVLGWTGSLGNILTASQGSGQEPWLESSSVYLNNQPYVRFDSALNTIMTCATVDATTASILWHMGVIRQDGQGGFDTLFNMASDGTGFRGAVFQINADGGLRQSAGANANDNYALSLGVWGRMRSAMSGTSADEYLQLRESVTTGTASAGSFGHPGMTLGNTWGETSGISASIACFGVWAKEPTIDEQVQIDTWVAQKYSGNTSSSYVTSSQPTAMDYVSASNVLLYNRSDLLLDFYSTSATLLTGWGDLSGNEYHWGVNSAGTTSTFPTFVASGGPNGHPFISADGSNDYFTSSFSIPNAPNTQPITLWSVVRFNSWTANDSICAVDGPNFRANYGVMQGPSLGSPGLIAYNGVNQATGSFEAPIGGWCRLEVYFGGSAAVDYIKAGSSTVAQNAGNSSCAGYNGATLFARPYPSSYAHADMLEFMYYQGALTAGERADLDAYVRDRYNILTDPANYTPWVDETDCICALRSDVVSSSSGVVTKWEDRTGNGYDFTPPDGAGTEPAYSGSGGDGPLGHAYVAGDGVDDTLYCSTMPLSVPDNNSIFVYMIVRQDSWTLNDRFFSAGSSNSRMIVYQNATTPKIRAFNGTLGTENSAATIGSWKRVSAYFSNSTDDFLRVGGTNVEGTNIGNTAPSLGMSLFAARTSGTSPSQWSDISVAEFLVFKNKSPEEVDRLRERLDQYASVRYGGDVCS